MSTQSNSERHGTLTWRQLAFLGLGFTTGTGFFLGTGLAIEKSGFSVLLLFLFGSIATFFVFSLLAEMFAKQQESGSFRSYSKQAYGHWAGFVHGWIYWTSEILILGSQLTGLGLFMRYWFGQIPLWLLSSGFAVLGVAVVLLGTKGFEQAENILAVIKISALSMFIILAFLVFTGILGKDIAHMHTPEKMDHILANGITGAWTGLIYVFFAFAGIEVMGIMATELKKPKDVLKTGRLMIPVLTALFTLSVGLTLLLAPFESFTADESPFVTALKDIRFTILIHIFNGVLIVAGFSSLCASLFSVTKMAYTIAKDGDAPKFLVKINKRNIPYGSLLITIVGMIVSIIVALVLPKKVYEYITTAGGLMLLYTWFMIVMSAYKVLQLTVWGHIKAAFALLLITAAMVGTLLDKSSRIGFLASVVFLVIIGGITIIMQKQWKHASNNKSHAEDQLSPLDITFTSDIREPLKRTIGAFGVKKKSNTD